MTDPQVIHDILIKAAEDVQEGMWCIGAWFTSNPDNEDNEFVVSPETAFSPRQTVAKLSKLHRCAEGSILLSTRMAGHGIGVYHQALHAVQNNLKADCESCRRQSGTPSLNYHNDTCLSRRETGVTEEHQFEAGQRLAELFRVSADRVINPPLTNPFSDTAPATPNPPNTIA